MLRLGIGQGELVSGEGDLYAHRQLIAALAVKSRLPAMCPYRDYVEAGGLMAYAVDLAELLRRMADDVHKILKGAKPGDIPIYQPTKFELLINLKTAKALGLTLSPRCSPAPPRLSSRPNPHANLNYSTHSNRIFLDGA